MGAQRDGEGERPYRAREAGGIGVVVPMFLLVAAPTACENAVSSGTPSTDSASDGDDDASSFQPPTDLGAPEDCEARQLTVTDDVAGVTDVAAICEGHRIVSLHRPAGVACASDDVPILPCVDPGGECVSDADCDAVVGGGECVSFDGLGGACRCVRECSTDADCPENRACLCRAGVVFDGMPQGIIERTACWPAECRSDSECGEDAECALVNPGATCVLSPTLRCRDASDGCRSDLDCASGEACDLDTTGEEWLCRGASVCQ